MTHIDLTINYYLLDQHIKIGEEIVSPTDFFKKDIYDLEDKLIGKVEKIIRPSNLNQNFAVIGKFYFKLNGSLYDEELCVNFTEFEKGYKLK